MSKYRWTICALLFFATTINYLDRQVLSLLQPLLSEEFEWTNSHYADITAIFQFSYAITMLFVGRLIDWLGTKSGYVLAMVIWSIGAILHALSISIGTLVSPLFSFLGILLPVSVVGFIVSRFVLAIGESGNFPVAIKTVAEWFPKKERSFATGIFNSGCNIGAILAPLSVPWIAYKWGWQSAFIIIGAVGFLWLVFWLIFYDSPSNLLAKGKITQSEFDFIHSDTEDQENGKETNGKITWIKLLSYRQTWSFICGKFITDGVWWFFLFWLPAYLKASYDIEGIAIMLPLTVLYSMTMIGSIGGGWLPTYFINKGMNAYTGRMWAMLIIALFPLVVLFAQSLGLISMWFPIVIIGIAASAHQAWSANIFTTVSDMFPKKTVATITGIGGMAGGIGGVIITKIAGALFDHYKALGHIELGYTILFGYCGIAYLLAWSVMKLLVPKFKAVKTIN